jgi:hypothetical protein
MDELKVKPANRAVRKPISRLGLSIVGHAPFSSAAALSARVNLSFPAEQALVVEGDADLAALFPGDMGFP